MCLADTVPVEVKVYPETIRNIGGITKLNRKQFITYHESYGSGDMGNEDFIYFTARKSLFRLRAHHLAQRAGIEGVWGQEGHAAERRCHFETV